MCQLRLSSAHAASRSRIDLNRLGKTRIWVFKPMAGSFRTPLSSGTGTVPNQLLVLTRSNRQVNSNNFKS